MFATCFSVSIKFFKTDSLQGLGVDHCPTAIHLQVPPAERDTRHEARQDEAITCVCSCVSEWETFLSSPVVHVPEKLQVELVDGVVDLLPVALH